MLAAPLLPLGFELRPMIRKNRLRKPPLPLQNRNGFSRGQLMIKLLSRNDGASVVLDAHHKPRLLSLNAEGPAKVDLPQLIRLLSAKEVPMLKLAQVPVLIISCQNVVDGFT